MNPSYELVNWIMLAGAAILGVTMVLNHLALLAARRQKRSLAAGQSEASQLDRTSEGPVA
jgi:hypothetical protein